MSGLTRCWTVTLVAPRIVLDVSCAATIKRSNTSQYGDVRSSTLQYRVVLCSTEQYFAVRSTTL